MTNTSDDPRSYEAAAQHQATRTTSPVRVNRTGWAWSLNRLRDEMDVNDLHSGVLGVDAVIDPPGGSA